MKKVLIIISFLLSTQISEAAIQTFSSSDTGSQTRTKLNANFGELDTNKAGVSCFANSTAFNACFTLDWPTGFDTAGDYTVTGAWDFTGATVTGISGAGDITGVVAGTGLSGGATTGDATLSISSTYTQRRVSSSCSAGSSIRAIAEDGTVTCETDSEGSGSLPDGNVNHDTLEWNATTSAWEPITPVELTDGTGIDIVNGVVSVTANTYQPLDSDLTTAAGAGTAGNSKYFGTNSSGSAGFHDLPTGGGGSFAFDTFPAYEDSAHSSGIAVNGTTLAVYSSTAGKWLTAALSDTLDAAPATYILTLDGSDWNGTDSVTVGASTLTADGTFTGLSNANTAVTCTPDTGRTCVCTGAEVTGTAPDYVVDMSDSNESMACTFADVVAGLSVSDSFTYSDGDLNNVANWDGVTGRGSLLIVSGKISGWADDWQSSIWKASDAFAANQEACLSVDTLGNKMGIGVRASSTEFTGYYLAAAADGTYLFRYNNETRTDIVSYAAITAGQTICLRVSGTTLTAKINGVDQVSQTDATISTGNPSVISYGTVGRGDNFTARDL